MDEDLMPTVMVDELNRWPGARHPFDRGSCHLTVDGDTPEHLAELHRVAAAIGLRRAWFQRKRIPHYDLTPGKRSEAIAAGAVEVSAREQAVARLRRRSDQR